MTIAVIGAGNIGSAVAKILRRTGCDDRVIATDKYAERLRELEEIGVTVTKDNKKAANEADIVVLCVKPRDIRSVLEEIRDETRGKLVISIAAAIPLSFLKKAAPEAKLVRAMPNMAVLVQESFTAYCAGTDVTNRDKTKVEKILSCLGRVVEIDESQMDAMTALSGCAPAYLSVVIEGMVHAGLEAGLPEHLALVASAQVMVGTGKLVLEAEKKPSEIVGTVATPGGVTEEELKELAKFPIKDALVSAVKAGTAKSKRISKALAQEESH